MTQSRYHAIAFRYVRTVRGHRN